MKQLCPCGSGESYQDCCNRIHENPKAAASAEALMRARYAAFCLQHIDFLYDTFHPQTRRYQQKAAITAWAEENQWQELQIIQASVSRVEFKAYYIDRSGDLHIHHEKSAFKQLNSQWYYVDGEIKG